MSSVATIWAARQHPSRPADKLVLWAMADQPMPVGEFMSFASVAAIVEFTGLDRKTVLAAQARLKAEGLIRDTGRRRGNTRQIIVWALPVESIPKPASLGTVPKTEQSQKRNGPVSPFEQSQKRDTDTEREPENTDADASVQRVRANAQAIVDLVETMIKFAASSPPKPKAKRAAQLSDGWTPRPLTGLSAEIVDRWEVGRLERVLDSFRNHHAGKGSRMVDWDAAWRTWIGNEEKFDSRNNRNGQRSHHDRQPAGIAINPMVRAGIAREARYAAAAGEDGELLGRAAA